MLGTKANFAEKEEQCTEEDFKCDVCDFTFLLFDDVIMLVNVC